MLSPNWMRVSTDCSRSYRRTTGVNRNITPRSYQDSVDRAGSCPAFSCSGRVLASAIALLGVAGCEKPPTTRFELILESQVHRCSQFYSHWRAINQLKNNYLFPSALAWLFVVGWCVATLGRHAGRLCTSASQIALAAPDRRPSRRMASSAVVPPYLEAIGFAPAYCSAVRGASNFKS